MARKPTSRPGDTHDRRAAAAIYDLETGVVAYLD
jgi:hypothetical protein